MLTQYKTVETPKIGSGIYTAADAARILKIPYPKANYWFRYYIKNKLSEQIGYQYYFEIKDITAVSFLSLIEMYVFYTLKEKGMNTNKIMDSHFHMSDFLKTPYPFASKNLYTDGKCLLFEIENNLISADKARQIKIRQVLEPFFKKIEFSEQGLARKFYPLGRKHTIVVNPENQFGQPIIDGTNILTSTIYSFHLGGESIKSIRNLYNVSTKNILDAIAFSKAA